MSFLGLSFLGSLTSYIHERRLFVLGVPHAVQLGLTNNKGIAVYVSLSLPGSRIGGHDEPSSSSLSNTVPVLQDKSDEKRKHKYTDLIFFI